MFGVMPDISVGVQSLALPISPNDEVARPAMATSYRVVEGRDWRYNIVEIWFAGITTGAPQGVPQ